MHVHVYNNNFLSSIRNISYKPEPPETAEIIEKELNIVPEKKEEPKPKPIEIPKQQKTEENEKPKEEKKEKDPAPLPPKPPISINFTDKNLFKGEVKISQFKIAKVKVWNDADRIFGLRLTYEDKSKSTNQIEGILQVPTNFQKKPFEEKILEGKVKKVFYKVGYDSWIRSIIFECEVGEPGKTKNVEYFFGSKMPISECKEIALTEDKILLKTMFMRREGFYKLFIFFLFLPIKFLRK